MDRPPSDATGTDLLSVGTVKEVLHSDATGMDHLSVGIVKGGLLLDATGMDLPTDVTGKARLMDATGRVLHLAVANALNVGIAGITVIDIPIKVRSVTFICGLTKTEIPFYFQFLIELTLIIVLCRTAQRTAKTELEAALCSSGGGSATCCRSGGG